MWGKPDYSLKLHLSDAYFVSPTIRNAKFVQVTIIIPFEKLHSGNVWDFVL